MTTLTDVEFADLAAGDPDRATVEKLATGQFNKRILLINAVLDRTAERCPAAHPALDVAYALLTAVQAADPAAVSTVLNHPGVGIWATGCLRRLHRLHRPEDAGPETALAQFAAIAAAAAIRAGHPFAIEVPVREGAVMLPTLGLADVPDATTAVVSFRNGVASVSTGDRTVVVPKDPSNDAAGWRGLRRLRAGADSTAVAVVLDDLDPDRSADPVGLAGRQDAAAVATWQSILDATWTELVHRYPRRARALGAGLRCIAPLVPGSNGASVTARDAFGGIVMTPPVDPLGFADTLIHEFQHSLLYAVMDLVPLHTAGHEAVHYSPWRDDPRPVEGLLHGAYAYLGVVDFWRGQREALTGRQRLLADFEFARWRAQVADAAQVLLDAGVLTDAGEVFAAGMARVAADWQEQQVAAEAQMLADRTVADHLIRWRLRHRHPDAAAVTRIATAYHTGRACPLDPTSLDARVEPHPPGQPLGARTPLWAARLREPDPVFRSVVGPGDLALVRDDLATAEGCYKAALAADPGDVEAWAGLALCRLIAAEPSASVVAPEVVTAVHRLVGGDPTDLDRWLVAAFPDLSDRHQPLGVPA